MNIPTGKNMFLWKIKRVYGGDPELIAKRAVELGLSGVIIKILSGYWVYNWRWDEEAQKWVDDFIQPLADALHAVGVKLYGFQYIYLTDGKKEAEAVIAQVEKYGLDGLFVDAEAGAKYDNVQAKRYADELLENWDYTLPIGLCSYRFSTIHPELPWDELLAACTFHAPQVYWVSAHNPVAQLNRSIAELQEKKLLPFVPVGSAYREHGWEPEKSELDEFDAEVQRLGLLGIAWWEWYEAIINPKDEDGKFDEVIAAHVWSVPEPPDEPPDDDDDPPPVDDPSLVERVTALEGALGQLIIEFEECESRVEALENKSDEYTELFRDFADTIIAHEEIDERLVADVGDHSDWLEKNEARIVELEKDKPPDNQFTILVKAIDKVALHVIVGHDRSCDGKTPPGKPILLPPPMSERIVYQKDTTFWVNAHARVSCHDDPLTPTIKASGGKLFHIIAKDQLGAGQFARADKVVQV